MNRVLIISLILILTILGFIFFKNFDYVAFLKIGDYVLESSIFTLLAFLILSVLLLIIFLKTAFFFFDLPFLIKKKWKVRKEQKINESILQSAIYLLIGDKNKAYQFARKIDLSSIDNKNHQDLLKIVKAKAAPDLEQKIFHYKSLQETSDYEFLALKNLAKINFKEQRFIEAEKYSLKAYYLNKSDGKILQILAYSYANLNKWEKFDEIIKELTKVDKDRVTQSSLEIAEFYLKAAKDAISQNKDKEAIFFTESGLLIAPSKPQMLELYINLNLSIKKDEQILRIVQDAFAANPSLAIAEIYTKFFKKDPKQIYQELESLVDPKDHVLAFLAIASYLNLPNKTGYFYT